MSIAASEHGPIGPAKPPKALIDGHLDLASMALTGRDLLAEHPQDAHGCVTLPALRRGGVALACATIFTESGGDPATNPLAYLGPTDVEGAAAAGRRQLEWYLEMERRNAVRIVRRLEDLPALEDSPVPSNHGPAMASEAPLSIVLLMECADPIREPEDAAWWVAQGIRMVGLSWARGSRYAGGNASPGALTSKGEELVRALDELGVVHDLSHLCDASFDQLLDVAKGPVVASHSNSRVLAGDSQRHLNDRQIQAIAQRQGVIGLNLFGRFMVQGRRATLEDAVAHVQRVAALGGRGTPALGSDLDGGFGPSELPVGLESPERLQDLLAALGRAAPDSEIDLHAFAAGNWLRVLREALARHRS